MEHGASESELGAADEERADISLFVRELLLGSLLVLNQDIHRDNLISGILSNPVPNPPSRLAGRLGPVPRSYSAITNFRARLSNSRENSLEDLKCKMSSFTAIETDNAQMEEPRIPSTITSSEGNDSLSNFGNNFNNPVGSDFSFYRPNLRLLNCNPGNRHHDSGDLTSQETSGGNSMVFGYLDLREELPNLPESGENRDSRVTNSFSTSFFPSLSFQPSNRMNSGEFLVRGIRENIFLSSRDSTTGDLGNTGNQNVMGGSTASSFCSNETGNQLSEKGLRKDKSGDDPSCSQ